MSAGQLMRRGQVLRERLITNLHAPHYSSILASPVTWFQEDLTQPGLSGTGFGMIVVVPAHQRRQAHQNRFGAATALQTKERTAIPDQIELNVPAAPIQLKLTFAIRVGERL